MTKIDTSTEAVEALLKDVTQGPWGYIEGIANTAVEWFGCGVSAKGYDFLWLEDDPIEDEATARFIAAARELVPALLAERDALIAEVERLKDQVDEVWKEAIDKAVKVTNLMANDALTAAAREHAEQMAEAINELSKGESHE